MAGAAIKIDIQDQQVLDAFNRLLHAVQDPEPAWRDIGEYLLISHRDRFDRQVDPEGRPWAPLSPQYRARKSRNRDIILVFNGYLRDLLRYQTSSTEFVFGTDRIYGATHQFGDPDRNIPPRPFLGISDNDRREILDIFNDHLRAAWRA
jgi:phage virion morphogenesis protein